MNRTLNSIFDLCDNEKFGACLTHGEVCSLAVNKEKTVMMCHVKFSDLIKRKTIKKLEIHIKEIYGFNRFNILPKYKFTCISQQYLDNLKELLVEKYPSSCGYLCDCKTEILDNEVVFHLSSSGVDYLMSPLRELSTTIYNETGLNIKINAIPIDNEQDYDKQSNSKRKEVIKKAIDIQTAENAASENRPKLQQPKPSEQNAYKKPRAKPLEIKKNESIIFGKPVEDKPVGIDVVANELGRVTIKGDVFFVETREIKAKNLTVINFDVTDYTSSIRVSKVMDTAKAIPIIEGVKVGEHLIVQGMMSYNTFERENVINPTSIVMSKKEVKRKDTAEKKRVELHAHTNMSAMDALSPIGDLAKRAKSWGHTAIAVTDHGVAQAFPDAMSAGKKNDIKIIYGVEAYYVNDDDKLNVVNGNRSVPLNGGRFIVFDVETTGLKPSEEKITEIAATVLENGEIVDSFQTYVNPKKHIPPFITELTGISDETVANAPDIKDAIVAFREFCKDDILVAHNAGFDISFINVACKEANITWDITYIDTLEMSRILLPNLSRHKLNILAKELEVGKFDHHRASEDAKILAYIFLKLIGKLIEEHGANQVSDINLLLLTIKKDTGGVKTLKSNHLIILVKNMIGLKNLYKLISAAHLEYFYKRPIMPRSLLVKHREGLIIGSACEAGELFRAITANRKQNEIEKIAKFYDYLEIQPILNNKFMIEKGLASDFEELKDFNRKIVELGEKLKIPVVATGDVHFLEPHDEIFRRVLMAGMGFSDADDQPPLYLKTTDEMLEEFDYLGREKALEVVVTNSNLVADMCETIYPIPKETFTPKMPNSDKELRDLCDSKAKELYGENLPEVVQKRLDKELGSIIGNGFDVLYMISQKLVAKSIEDGYLVGSRGSVGSSVVAFLSGITEVNALPAHYRCTNCQHSEFYTNETYQCGADMPDKNCTKCNTPYTKDGFDIPFETFLGFDGDKAPDIDLNFSGEYQSRAHKETEVLFGKGHTFRAGTIGTVAEKTAYGFVKKYLEEKGSLCSRAEENRLTQGCTGIKRTTGQHPGGIMVVPKENEIFEFCPIQHPADDPDSDIITTHFDYHSIHDNLLKLDLLGHDDPTMIKHLEDLTGVNARQIPLDDKDTMSIFTSLAPLGIDEDKILGTTGSLAVPEFGTKFVRGMLNDTKPTTFDELLRISGLSHGTDVWLSNAQDLVVKGIATLRECICCRDDIMNFLIMKGVEPKLSFTIMESVRKGKGLKPDWEDAMRANDVPEWYIDSCKKIKYMFPKAHAVAYVMMAFRIAWFKVHKPLAFYSAYFSIRAKGFDASTMIFGDDVVISKMNELGQKEKDKTITNAEKESFATLEVCHEFYRRGYKFAPMDVYNSDATKFLITDEGLIPPFTSMPGIGETAAQVIVNERKNGKFISSEELIMRCPKVSKSVVELLTSVGALRDMPKSSQISFF